MLCFKLNYCFFCLLINKKNLEENFKFKGLVFFFLVIIVIVLFRFGKSWVLNEI